MEEDKALDLPAEPKATGGSNKSLIIVVIGSLILVVVLAGLGAFFLLKNKKSAATEEGEVIEHAAKESKKIALYLILKPPFVIKAKSSGRQRYLQMEVALVTRDEKKLDQLKENIPQIRNAIVTSMGAQVLEELLQPEGREALQQSLLADLQAFMEEEHNDPLIDQVLFTTFIMQ
jgi:flagellar FliL protein